MNRLTDSLLPAYAVAATGLLVGAWLVIKGLREITAALTLPSPTDARIGRNGERT